MQYKMYFTGGNNHINGVRVITKKCRPVLRAVQIYLAILKINGRLLDLIVGSPYAPTRDQPWKRTVLF